VKEDAHDYRYFPEPDIPPMDVSKFDLGAIKKVIPELPQEKRARFAKEFNIKPEQIEILIADRRAAQFFEESVSELAAEDNQNLSREIQLAVNYLTSDLKGLMAEQGIGFHELKVNPENFADLIELISHEKISSRGAKDVLRKMCATGLDPHAVVKEGGMEQVSDEGELRAAAERVIAANPDAVTDFKKGKENALQFLVGKAMAALKGRGNPGALQRIFRDRLK
jgi:aspartyl-tRNA(Asn)/glutamyl-tRNA(Gln) amidotransferase subunit B